MYRHWETLLIRRLGLAKNLPLKVLESFSPCGVSPECSLSTTELREPGAEEAAVPQVPVPGSAEAACASGACPGTHQNQEEKPLSHALSF